MIQIPLDIWGPNPDKPGTIICTEQRTYKAVFEELENFLKGIGYVPDDYFQLSAHLEKHDDYIPKESWISCQVDYGSSEGIYIDIYLHWDDDGKRKTNNFITGKTLDASGASLDRMYLVASAVTQVFGSGYDNERYVKLDTISNHPEAGVIHLTAEEYKLIIDNLTASLTRLDDETRLTQQLLRRMTGSITDYVNQTGARPLQMSIFDQMVLAVQDGSMESFNAVYPKLDDKTHIFPYVCSRPGAVGREMTNKVLSNLQNDISPEIFLETVKQTAEYCDIDRVYLLYNQAEEIVTGFTPSFHGEIISALICNEQGNKAIKLINHSTKEQIAAADPGILLTALHDIRIPMHLAEDLMMKGLNANPVASDVIKAIHNNKFNRFGGPDLLMFIGHNLKVNPDNYPAMKACIDIGQNKAAELLIEGGYYNKRPFDWIGFKTWLEENNMACDPALMSILDSYWASLQPKSGQS